MTTHAAFIDAVPPKSGTGIGLGIVCVAQDGEHRTQSHRIGYGDAQNAVLMGIALVLQDLERSARPGDAILIASPHTCSHRDRSEPMKATISTTIDEIIQRLITAGVTVSLDKIGPCDTAGATTATRLARECEQNTDTAPEIHRRIM